MTTLYNMFNFDPIETTIKTTSYTIPAGRYALAYPSFSAVSVSGSNASSGTMGTPGFVSLNSVTLFHVEYNFNYTSSSGTFNFPSGYPKVITSNASTSGTSGVGSFTNGVQSITIFQVASTGVQHGASAGKFCTNTGSVSSINNVNIVLYIEDARKEKYKNGIWVKAGDVLAGTNALGSAYEWTITEFNSLPS